MWHSQNLYSSPKTVRSAGRRRCVKRFQAAALQLWASSEPHSCWGQGQPCVTALGQHQPTAGQCVTQLAQAWYGRHLRRLVCVCACACAPVCACVCVLCLCVVRVRACMSFCAPPCLSTSSGACGAAYGLAAILHRVLCPVVSFSSQQNQCPDLQGLSLLQCHTAHHAVLHKHDLLKPIYM